MGNHEDRVWSKAIALLWFFVATLFVSLSALMWRVAVLFDRVIVRMPSVMVCSLLRRSF